MDIALNYQPFNAPITMSIQTKRAIWPTSFLIGQKITTETDNRKTSLIVPFLYYQKLFKDFANSQKN
jgi:hypothetical protein